jgi:hypothetical protein
MIGSGFLLGGFWAGLRKSEINYDLECALETLAFWEWGFYFFFFNLRSRVNEQLRLLVTYQKLMLATEEVAWPFLFLCGTFCFAVCSGMMSYFTTGAQ